MSGFYKMNRGWLEHPALSKDPFDRRSAWAWIIEHAAWAPVGVCAPGGFLKLDRGQLSYSLRYLAKAWKWDEARVRRFLGRLEQEKMITCVIAAGRSVVTVCNYSTYQDGQSFGDAPTDAAPTQDRRGGDANNKKIKKLEEDKNIVPSELLVAEQPIDVSSRAWSGINGRSSGELADAMFEQHFWPNYPDRKGGKQPALLKFRQALKLDNAHNIMVGLARYYDRREEEGKPQFTKHAATWLGQRGWKDELAKMEEDLARRDH